VNGQEQGIEPSAEAGLVPQGGELVECSEKRFLEQVVPFCVRPGDAAGGQEKLIVNRSEKLRETLPALLGARLPAKSPVPDHRCNHPPLKPRSRPDEGLSRDGSSSRHPGGGQKMQDSALDRPSDPILAGF